MYAVILAGGFGTRLRALVPDLPKPMAPVAGKPFLEYVIANLCAGGFDNYIVCLHYKADAVIEYFGDGSQWGIEISYSLEEEPLGTGGALCPLRNRLSEEFCLVNGDTFAELEFKNLLRLHEQKQAVITMTLASVDDSSRYGTVLLDDGMVVGFSEKDPGFAMNSGDNSSFKEEKFINAGIYIFSPIIFDYIPIGSSSLEDVVIPLLLQDGRKVVGYKGAKSFCDIGVPQDYRRFQEWVTGNSGYKTLRRQRGR